MSRKLLLIIFTAGMAAAAGPAGAGQPCVEKPATPQLAETSANLAKQVRERLEKAQLSIAFLGRIGVDLSEFGLRYTHLAVAWRDHPRGRWYTFHLLNKCGTGQSELLEQSLEDFFLVELHRHEALVVAPSFPVQLRLQRAFFSPTAAKLHETQYNMIAHPFSTRYQNSNQWVLEVLASAMAPAGAISSRQEAQAWLKDNRYVPEEIPIPTTRRSAAVLFSPHVRFSDHTDEEWKKSRYAVVSVESILRFLERLDPAMTQEIVK